jgi:hypothetical protein
MKSALVSFALFLLALKPAAGGNVLLYDNTLTADDTGDFVPFSGGPYIALGDQLQLVSAGIATQAKVELFNNGLAGTFDAELDLFSVGSPVGSLLGSFVYPTSIASAGGDVLDLTFNLGAGVTVPQNIVFTVSVGNVTTGVDLGVDMFSGPEVGVSDPLNMIVETTPPPTFSELPTNDENVYFQLSGTAVPEVPGLIMAGSGLLLMGFGFRRTEAWRHRRVTWP